MDAEPVTIPADLPAAQAYEDFFLRYQGWEWFAVVDPDGRFVGLAHREPLRQVVRGRRRRPPGARAVVPPSATRARCSADAPLEALLGSEPLRRLGALMAVDRDGPPARRRHARAGHRALQAQPRRWLDRRSGIWGR